MYGEAGLPDQLEGVVDEVSAVVAAQRGVVGEQQAGQGTPALGLVVHHVVTTHIHVELHPQRPLWQVQHIYTGTQFVQLHNLGI